jgi:hypothetical protein
MNYIYDIPEGLPEHDVRLLMKARRQRWEDIDPDAAKTEKARDRLQDIALRKYHYAECREDNED